ncbi:S46 family peptidase [bacterium]|nr:S46 family peptidase [bacterium]
MKKRMLFFLLTALFIVAIGPVSLADEGMYPISELHKLNLKAKGLEMDLKDLYNPNGVSLMDGICKVGGATGSFVSADGLILTNHHVAYGGVSRASSEEHDYLQNGFLAKDRSGEIQARGYTVRITESYKDVSKQVLKAVKKEMSAAERTKAIEQKIKEIEADAEKKYEGKSAQVSEMFRGKTYVLFIYTTLRDIRLVYVPPRAIGNFGGEEDNWMWPRHTGDFSYLRAYVAPDGSSAGYSEDNVPYHPKSHLKVAPDGVNEGDFVFILGYPGRTYRHQTSHYLEYEETYRMPFVADYYEWQITALEDLGKDDRGIALKLASRIKGLSNTMKNYRGKLQGMRRMHLVEKKRDEERKLQQYIDADNKRREKYGSLLAELNNLYTKSMADFESDMVLSYLPRSSSLLSTASTLYTASLELKKDDMERQSGFMERNWNRTKQGMLRGTGEFYEPSDRLIFEDILLRAARLPADQRLEAVTEIVGDGDPAEAVHLFVDHVYSSSKLADRDALEAALEDPAAWVESSDDPFLKLARELYPVFEARREENRERSGEMDKLYAELLDVKREFMATDFIPDANSTLRFTFGRIKGYSPRDAVYCDPLTTVNGVLEKTTGEEPFDTPQKLQDLIRKKDFGRFAHPELKTVPTAILYDMDTTGGNSGSPVLNARGELVGINFDRAWEATINDYAWSPDYSRSIAVDIRYVLWVTQKFAGAGYLLTEMGVEE